MKRFAMWLLAKLFPLDTRSPGWKSVAMSLTDATAKGDWR